MARGKKPRKDAPETEPRFEMAALDIPAEAEARESYEPIVIPVPVYEQEEKRLYWFGALPHPGTLPWKIHLSERSPTTGDFHRYKNVTAKDLWNGKVDNDRCWAGKLRRTQNPGFGGWIFPAYTEERVNQIARENSTASYVPWPGAVGALTNSQVQRIAGAALRTVIRTEANGNESQLSLDAGLKPKEMTDDAWNRLELKIPVNIFNPRTDKPIAEYVYMVKLAADAHTTQPDNYYKLITRITDWERFFDNPPPMMAQFITKPEEVTA